jgi:hypothetical protein
MVLCWMDVRSMCSLMRVGEPKDDPLHLVSDRAPRWKLERERADHFFRGQCDLMIYIVLVDIYTINF